MNPPSPAGSDAAEQARWLPGGRPGDARTLPLFLLPPAGGAAALYRDDRWQDDRRRDTGSVGVGVTGYPVELPGRGARLAEPLVTELEELVRRLDDACRPRHGEPWAVLGHSMGALLATAWAAHACRLGHGPRALYLSAAAPPWHSRAPLELTAGDDAQLWRALSGLGGVSPAQLASPAAARYLTRIMRADLTAVVPLCLRAPEPLGCPVVVLSGAEDPACPPELLDGWRELAGGAHAATRLPGAHFYRCGLGDLAPVVRADLAGRLAGRLAGELTAATVPAAPR
ncbi:thioesterase [Streptacidiphilus sp. 4-A2]|nr:thioesterase [Streptacidiphilus sp. 4-A2]